jgi:hypothetical protein
MKALRAILVSLVCVAIGGVLALGYFRYRESALSAQTAPGFIARLRSCTACAAACGSAYTLSRRVGASLLQRFSTRATWQPEIVQCFRWRLAPSASLTEDEWRMKCVIKRRF